MVTARAEIPWLCVKSFSSCFWDIGHRASSSDWNSFTVCAPCAAQAMSRFVCKKLVRDPDELFCMSKTAGIVKKYDLARFWWAFCLFFSKGQFQSLARQGFVF